jgi:hypothetical protein
MKSDRQGLGFSSLIQLQPPLSITIKAALNASPSVFVAEATTLALGATLLHIMHLNPVNFFTDDQLLSHYINSTWYLEIPDWRVGAYTHHLFLFDRCIQGVQHFKKPQSHG